MALFLVFGAILMLMDEFVLAIYFNTFIIAFGILVWLDFEGK